MRYSNHIVDETTHAFKCAKWFALVSSLLLGIFGTVLLIWPNTSMNVICTLLGVLMVVFGVSKIVGYFFNVSYHIGFQFDLALGLFALLFGILFLTHPGAILSITWVLVGIYEIVESVFKIQTAMDARQTIRIRHLSLEPIRKLYCHTALSASHKTDQYNISHCLFPHFPLNSCSIL